MAAVIALAATKSLPIHVAAFLGVIAMLGAGCVKLHGLGRALSMQVVPQRRRACWLGEVCSAAEY